MNDRRGERGGHKGGRQRGRGAYTKLRKGRK